MKRITVLCKSRQQFDAWVRNKKRLHTLCRLPEIKVDHEWGLAWCVRMEGSWVAECVASDVAYPRKDVQFDMIDEVAVTGSPQMCGAVFTFVAEAVKKNRSNLNILNRLKRPTS